MNRRASVSIVLLVLGVFAVCTLALLSFFSYRAQVRDSFVGVGTIQDMNARIEDYLVFSDVDRAGATLSGDDVVFYDEIIERGGLFGLGDEHLKFSVQYRLARPRE